MIVQTTFAIDYTVGTPGQLADVANNTQNSKLAAATVPFGTFVSRRASPADAVSQCGNPAATADVTARGIGIALKSEVEGSAGVGYVANDGVDILTKGKCYVNVEGVVTDGQDLFVRFAAGAGGSQLGAFRADADTASAVALPGLKARQTTTGAGLCLVEINLP